MTQKNEYLDEKVALGPNGPVHPRRRRILSGTAAGVGVLLAIQAKTALGATSCQSPSAMISGNTSPRPGDGRVCSGGRSPGFWKQPQHFAYWAASGLACPTFNVQVQTCMQGLSDITPCNLATIGSRIDSVFTGAPGGDKGIWEVLAWPTNYPKIERRGTSCRKLTGSIDAFGGQGQLLRHLACAYLNAAYFNSVSQDYPLSQAQVIEMWQAVKGGGIYCPTGMTCANGTGMSATQIITYIQNLYDINADVEGDICKKI